MRNSTHLRRILTLIGVVLLAPAAVQAAIIAADDVEGYSSFSYGTNGGTGLGASNYREGTGGGVFLSTGGERVDGAKSFGLFSSSGGQAYDRSINTPTTWGQYKVSARFNLDNAIAFSGFNLKSGAGATFGANELLSFGMRPTTGNNAIFIGGSVNASINLGSELRGAVIDFDVIYNTTLGTYDVGAKLRSSPTFTRTTGNLKSTGNTATTLGYGNFNTGTNQNLIIDSVQLESLPEPTMALTVVGLLAVGISRVRRSR